MGLRTGRRRAKRAGIPDRAPETGGSDHSTILPEVGAPRGRAFRPRSIAAIAPEREVAGGVMDRGIWWRLAGMMALIYAVQGAFWPLLAVHLRDVGVDGRGRGWIFATLSLGSLAMPLGAGQLVDRFMPAQRFLALAYG